MEKLAQLKNLNLSNSLNFGIVKAITPNKIIGTDLNVSIGDLVEIKSLEKKSKGLVTSIDKEQFIIIPFSNIEGFDMNSKIYKKREKLTLKVSDKYNGRIINGLGEPIDGKGAIYDKNEIEKELISSPVPSLERDNITEVFATGVRSIDGLLTVGKGQKMGIFAGSGVGKSTLMGMITKNSESDIKVIALIGERGREVKEFIEKNLNNDLTNIILIVATSDESPVMRKMAAFTALSIAEYYRDKKKNVLFVLDSITRIAIAQREIGLLSGELPALKGYTPSVFSLLPQLLERIANINGGYMTGFFTVLVDGDNFNEPIADHTRSILDGHIILNRKLTESGIYPPVDVLKSASRVVDSILPKEMIDKQNKFRHLLSILEENKMIIKLGTYVRGSNKEIDEAINQEKLLLEYIKQDKEISAELKETVEKLQTLL